MTCSLALAACGGGAQAGGEYPSKTIRLVTHSPAGSGGDLFARPLAEALSDALGVDVRLENRPGGLTAAAMNVVKNSDPDGYVLTIPNDSFITAPITENTNYSIQDDLTPIARLIVEGEVLFVAGDSPYQTIDDLMGALDNGPQKWATQGGTTAQAILIDQMIADYGLPIEKVAFTDTDSTVTSVINGDTVASIGELSEASDLAKAGKIRILATTTPERLDGEYADLPTLVESGFDVSMTKSRGLAGPEGLPDDVVAAVEQAAQDVLADKDYQEILATNYQIDSYLGHDEYEDFLAEMDATYRAAVEATQ
jgi:putative tricarboxylic transport membrane protein